MSQSVFANQREVALRFVPELLVDYLSKCNRQGPYAIQPSSFFMHGVCLLADISGFTKLSGDFCSRGKGGIDELQLATNSFMEKLVEIIYSFGGDIIKFAGDAIICVFSADFKSNAPTRNIRKSMCGFESLDLDDFLGRRPSIFIDAIDTSSSISGDVVLRAMHCANTLRAVQTEKLTVHVAMSCGEMCFGILGGVENRWECLISGPCIHQLSGCLDDAPSKEAVMSRDCAATLFEGVSHRSSPICSVKSKSGGSGTDSPIARTSLGAYEFRITPMPSGNFRIIDVVCAAHKPVASEFTLRSASEAQEDRLTQVSLFVPAPIADELSTGDALHSLAEIREVTTMFMKWESYDPTGKHRDLLELQTCFYRAQRILHNTGAYLRQFLVDDKGCVLIGCWGMPHLSYLDNAQRALAAAVEIKYELNKLDMKCSFGITTGDVYCGTVGSALRMEYAAIGSVVNMSARLMCKAKGGILIDGATYGRLPQSSIRQLQGLGPILVKGRVKPLHVFKYVPETTGVEKLKLKVVEDHEISSKCKTILLDILRRVATSADAIAPVVIRPKPVPSPLWTTWFTSVLSSVPRSAPSPTDGMRVVLIEGREGSGRSTVLNWLHAQAVEASLPVCFVKLSKKTSYVEYGLWRRVFQQLMPRYFYESVTEQREQALLLLSTVLPGATLQARTVALMVMQSVLGLQCDASTRTKATRRGSGLFTTQTKPGSSRRANTLPVAETLFTIFAHLLKETATLLVIDCLCHADDSSLKLLQLLCEVPCSSAIVCAVLIDSQCTPVSSSRRTDTSARSDIQFDHGSSCLGPKMALQQRALTTTITMENYTYLEIDQMLSVTLKTDEVPLAISQLVMDFSGGSYFWVREILQFIKEHGPELFIAAVGADHQTLDPPPSRARTPPSQHLYARSLTPTSRSLSRHKSMRQPSMRKVPVTAHQVHLDKLVLCRFESLSPEMQRILRTASIVGVCFSADVLEAMLPSLLQSGLPDTLITLLNQKWLYQDTDNASLYEFAHPHAHQIIYELTPSSERAHQHQLVADYIEETCGEDETLYSALCYHYQHCDTDKALRYCIMAVTVLLDAAAVIFDYGDCLDLLQSMEPHCRTAAERAQLKGLTKQLLQVIVRCKLQEESPPSAPFLTFVYECIGSVLTRRKQAAVRPEGVAVIAAPLSSPHIENTAAGKTSVPKGGTFGATSRVEESPAITAQKVLLRGTNVLLTQLSASWSCMDEAGSSVATPEFFHRKCLV